MLPAKKHVVLVVIVLSFPVLVGANGLNLNGLGSRALSMGGAFVAVADDFSSLFWNPAGAAGFTKTLAGIQVFDLIPSGTYRYGTPPAYLVDAKTIPAHVFGGLLTFYKPVSSRIVVGFGISTPSGMGGEWYPEDFSLFSDGILYKWSTRIGVVSFSPLVAVKLSDVVSIGATVNLNYGKTGMATVGGYTQLPDGPEFPVDLGQYDESMDGWAVGATFGVLVTPGEMFRFGLTVKTPYTLKFQGRTSTSLLPLYGHPGISNAERAFTWPLVIDGGAAVKPWSRLLVTAGVQWSQWSSMDRNVTVYEDPYQAELWANEGYDDILLAWEDKVQIRFGAEYTLSRALTLRAGYCYDPAPSPITTINILLPSFTYDTFTVGVGYTMSDLRIDASLEYMDGKERIAEYSGTNDPGIYGMRMVIPSVSISYRF